MGLLSRLATFFRIRASAALDKAEDPGQVMDYSYNEQLKQLQQLRHSIADVVTSEKRLEMQQRQLQVQHQQVESLGLFVVIREFGRQGCGSYSRHDRTWCCDWSSSRVGHRSRNWSWRWRRRRCSGCAAYARKSKHYRSRTSSYIQN